MIDKVAVLLGGNSSEKEISLKSGYSILNGLKKAKINAYPIDIKLFPLIKIKEFNYTRVFIALHGKGGEDGIIQGVLEMLKLPYTGSKVLASALAMDKLRSKQLWSGINLPVAPYVFLKKKKIKKITDKELFQFVQHLGMPLIIKPTLEGSSIGISKINTILKLKNAINTAFKYDETILIEKCLNGPEYTVGIIGDKILPAIRIQTKKNFFDYYAKYQSLETKYFCPSGLSKIKELKLKKIAYDAYQSIGCSGWGRVDLMENNNNFFLLEVNTSPGMTKKSLIPIAAQTIGISFSKLVKKILELAE
ncbi:MAG: D-alanine--D-alanine ligase [Arsenophonus sp.]|nr:MAG: D-alanine--D-alanine ligase [Arsenophonus sp.]